MDARLERLAALVNQGELDVLDGMRRLPQIKLPQLGHKGPVFPPKDGVVELNKSPNPRFVAEMKRTSPYRIQEG